MQGKGQEKKSLTFCRVCIIITNTDDTNNASNTKTVQKIERRQHAAGIGFFK
jgi:hypothetical protein